MKTSPNCYARRELSTTNVQNATVSLTGESFSLPSSPIPDDPAPSPLGSEGPCDSHDPSVVFYNY